MILADKIIELRKKNGWSQEELADKLGVSRQSVSKWESAQAVPDMNRIIKMSEIFGVSTDFLLKDNLELPVTAAEPNLDSDSIDSVRRVSMEEASGFLEHRDTFARRIALGVMMCILSPILIVVLAGMRESGRLALTENQVVGIGLVALFLLVGGAVALFIISGLRNSKYEYLSKERIETSYGVDGMVRDRREKSRSTFNRHIALGVVLCVIAAVPLFITMILFGGENAPKDDFPYAIAVGFLLLIVAFGVMLIIRAATIWDGFKILLEEGEFSRNEKAESKRNELISGVYWGLVTAVYLAYSFITNRWHRSWIIWPVAGVVYGVVEVIAKAMRKHS